MVRCGLSGGRAFPRHAFDTRDREYPLLGPAGRAEPRDNRHDSAFRPPPYAAAIQAGHSRRWTPPLAPTALQSPPQNNRGATNEHVRPRLVSRGIQGEGEARAAGPYVTQRAHANRTTSTAPPQSRRRHIRAFATQNRVSRAGGRGNLVLSSVSVSRPHRSADRDQIRCTCRTSRTSVRCFELDRPSRKLGSHA